MGWCIGSFSKKKEAGSLISQRANLEVWLIFC
jgi:hypothetical protein